MNNDKFAKLKVDSLFSQYKLSKINLDNLIYIIEDQGFEIIEFEVGEKSPSYSLLKDLNLTQYAQAGKALVLDAFLVFISKSPLCTKFFEAKKWQYGAKRSVLPQTKAI